jgi:hypothetical protein
MNDSSQRLPELLKLEPPAFLDALVRERTAAVLAQSHSVAPTAAVRAPVPPMQPSDFGPRVIAPAERMVYGAGLAMYGGHALYGVVRLLVRALSG